MFVIRDAQAPDYEAVATIHNLIYPEPVTADHLRDRDAKLMQEPDVIVRRLVAVTPGGEVVGYGVSAHSRESTDASWYAWVGVHPDYRRQGAGQALADALEANARAHGGQKLTSQCRGEDEAAFAWAQRQGFAQERQRTESVLDLTTFDRSRFAGAVERAEASGLAFFVSQEVPAEMLREVYETDLETGQDHPEFDGTTITYEQWLRHRERDTDPQVYVFAMDGGRIAGFSVVRLPTQPGEGAYTNYTCVRRQYRGRGVALACKLLTIDQVMARGVAHMRTNNNPENGPMLAVNAKLGYRLVPGPRLLVKVLG
ncbi:MAG: hypothetical protein K0R39_4175 [Symbiobacteriaceae bacterium]|nr:hypothetical protein [Symbiobacteriaceae bacterium]